MNSSNLHWSEVFEEARQVAGFGETGQPRCGGNRERRSGGAEGERRRSAPPLPLGRGATASAGRLLLATMPPRRASLSSASGVGPDRVGAVDTRPFTPTAGLLAGTLPLLAGARVAGISRQSEMPGGCLEARLVGCCCC